MVMRHCPKCKHAWDYAGDSKYYITCPHCYSKVKIDGIDSPSSNRTDKEDTDMKCESNLDPWTEFDLRDLYYLYNIKNDTIKIIAHKLRRSEEDVTNKMAELGLSKDPNTLMIPKIIKPKYDIKPKPEIFVDEDRLKITDHNLRAEQVQLQKDLLNENRKRGNDIVRAINDNTTALVQMEAALNKLIHYIEDATAGRLLKKKIEQETSPIQQTSES